MKKQTLAKLIVLGMVAAMLPISAFASGDDKTALELRQRVHYRRSR